MGIFRETFETLEYENEEDVKLKFIIPFFVRFFEYSERNIRPESSYTSLEFPFNRSLLRNVTELDRKGGRPDYIVENDEGDKLFIIEAKGPEEDIQHYEHQLQAYCTATKTNLIVVTNGTQFAVYDVNEPFLFCANILELEQNFDKISILLHKFNSSIDFKTRIYNFLQEIDLPQEIPDLLRNLNNFFEENSNLQDYIECLGEKVPRIVNYQIFEFKDDENTTLNFESFTHEIEEHRIDIIILRGNSGIGKSEFLKFLEYHFSMRSISGFCEVIPLFIDLNYWSLKKSLFDIIFERLKNCCIIDENFFRFLLKQGKFLILLDAFNELSLEDKKGFLTDYKNLNSSFPNLRIVISMKKDTDFQGYLEYKKLKTIYMESFRIEHLQDYYNSLEIKFSFDIFLQRIDELNLREIISTPLFLNYMLIYIKNKESFPQSKSEVISSLIEHYFKDFLRKKYFNFEILTDLKIWEVLLRKFSFFLKVELKMNKVRVSTARRFFKEQIENLKEKSEISNISTGEKIIDFYIKNNILIENEGYIKFWHQILFDYYGGCEFANLVNNEKISKENLKEFMRLNAFRESIIFSFPYIKVNDFFKEIEENDFFLYIEGMLETVNITDELLSQFQYFLMEKMNSDFNFILKLSLTLIKKILFHIGEIEEFLIKIIENKPNNIFTKWALLELGKLKSKKSKEYLLKFEGEFSLEVQKYIALCYFDEEEIHNQVIDSIENYWYGSFGSMEICKAIQKIEVRNQLSQKSFERIVYLYFNPPEKLLIARDKTKSVEKTIFKYHLQRFLALIILERADHSIYQKLIENLDYDNLNFLLTSNMISKLTTDEDQQKLLKMLKDDKISLNLKIPLVYILNNIYLNLDFTEILEFIKKIPSKIEDHKLGIFYSDFIRLLNNRSRFKNFNEEELLHLLPNYLEIDPLIQKSIVEVIGKYFPKFIFEKNLPKTIYFDTFDIILKIISKNKFERLKSFLIEEAKKCIPQWMNGRQQSFHNQFLFSNIIDTLLDLEYYNDVYDLIDQLINEIDDFNKFNAFSLRPINKLPNELKFKLIALIFKKCVRIESNDFLSMFLDSCIEPFNYDLYIEFCFQIIKENLNKDWLLASSHIYYLSQLNPKKKEKEMLELFETEIDENLINSFIYYFYHSGSSENIPIIEKYLHHPKQQIRNAAFETIRMLNENQNIIWYNNEEKYFIKDSKNNKS